MNTKRKTVILAAAVFLMYVVSGLLLLLLALLLYKLDLSEAAVRIGVIVIYLVTGMAGGIFAGKKLKEKKFLWGFMAGTLYFAILLLASVLLKQGMVTEPVRLATTFILCACSSMAGGMIS